MSTVGRDSVQRPSSKYCFSDFTLDLDGGFLRRGDQEVVLRPKAFEVLAYLVKRHGQLVPKSVLLEAVWPDANVTDNSLSRCLVEIRRALGDDAQEMIRTVARRGYVFTPAVNTTVVEIPHEVPARGSEHGLVLAPPVKERPPARKRYFLSVAVAFMALIVGLVVSRPTLPSKQDTVYTQITDFTDSAVAPVLSPDGRMVAFLRSHNWFLTPDQIFVKLLPDGEPVQLTWDTRLKCCMAFSSDGSRIAYTTYEPGPFGWKTSTVSTLGGTPALLLSNAAGLTWLDQRRFLFSEISAGFHMGIVTATEDRSDYRKIYFPRNERAMAHYSYASPDRKWALVVEMDPGWGPCRIIPLDGSSAGRQVGPAGQCTSAAWSPDGHWMYFSVAVGGNHHLYRQRFPQGEPEQITFGPTEEEGVAVAPDGRSLITSIGMQHSEVWIHDRRGERPAMSAGAAVSSGVHGIFPKFSANGKSLFYLIRRKSPPSFNELWRTDLDSGKSQVVLAGFPIVEYDISDDGKDVLFSTQPTDKPSQIWLASANRSAAPRRIASSGESLPHFAAEDQVLFQMAEGKTQHLARMEKDGSSRFKLTSYPIDGVHGISPDRRWVVAVTPLLDKSTASATMAIPVEGGDPVRICEAYCPAAWDAGARFLYVGVEHPSLTSLGKTLVIPLSHGKMLPKLPPSGIRNVEDGAAFPGSRIIEGWDISPGPDPSVYAFVKKMVHRNLFRIPLRNR